MAQSKAKRLTREELDLRAAIKIDKSIKEDGVNGIVAFGENNDYPQLIELVVGGSVTAKAAASTYSMFLSGSGFDNEELNNIVIGTDQRGKDITMLGLLAQTADSCSIHNGFYWHRNTNAKGVTGDVHLKPFKDGRFSKPDDTAFSAKLLFHQNWEKDKDKGKFKKEDAVAYGVFNNKSEAIIAQINADGGVKKFKGQVYFNFLDNQYFYPLSPFDVAYLDADTEQQLALYKNRQPRNGFFDKIICRVQPGIETQDSDGNSIENEGIQDEILKFLGADGETVFVFEDDIDPDTQEFYKNSFQIEHVKGNVDSKLFENWEPKIANNIRKAVRNIPAILIDYEQSNLGNTSGEAVVQATNFYNAITERDRAIISRSFEEVFSLSANETLKNNKNWKIKPLSLIDTPKKINEDGPTT